MQTPLLPPTLPLAWRYPRLITAGKAASWVLLIGLFVTGALFGAVHYYERNYGGCRSNPRADVQTLVTHLKTYRMANGHLPTTEQGLSALVAMPLTEPKPRQWFQLSTELPKDPWGNEYVYLQPGRHNPQGFDVFSKGPDGRENTADDIGNWRAP